MKFSIEKMPEHHFEALLVLIRVIMGVALVATLLLFAGCKSNGGKLAVPPPVEAKCDALCYLPCVGQDKDTGVRWTGNPDDAKALDELDNVVIPLLSEKLRTCETRRTACVLCLNNLEQQKVIIQ